jgi:rfaE bifunctional protein kinase chain/domain
MLRIDEEDNHVLSERDEDELIKRIGDYLNDKVDAVILEDYNKGVLTPNVISQTIENARAKGIPTAVDPKNDNFLAYKNATLFKPNFKELKEGLKLDFDKKDQPALENAVDQLEQILDNEITMVTLSELGIFVKSPSGKGLIPAHAREILDVSGAGDTVIGIAALCLACGLNPVDMAKLANLGGGLVCEKVGVVPVDVQQLISEAFRLEV